jgi:hypothetical protein
MALMKGDILGAMTSHLYKDFKTQIGGGMILHAKLREAAK